MVWKEIPQEMKECPCCGHQRKIFLPYRFSNNLIMEICTLCYNNQISGDETTGKIVKELNPSGTKDMNIRTYADYLRRIGKTPVISLQTL